MSYIHLCVETYPKMLINTLTNKHVLTCSQGGLYSHMNSYDSCGS